jgi:hypothetical protein
MSIAREFFHQLRGLSDRTKAILPQDPTPSHGRISGLECESIAREYLNKKLGKKCTAQDPRDRPRQPEFKIIQNREFLKVVAL